MTLVAISLYVLRQLLIGNTKAALIFYSDFEMSLSTKGKAQNFRKILCLKKNCPQSRYTNVSFKARF